MTSLSPLPGLGNRVIHLPSQLNTPNQLNPTYFSLGNTLGLSFADGTAQAAGYTVPYANFVNDFGGSATVGQSLTPFPQYSYVFNNFEGSGTTYYQSAQIEVEKRFTNGLNFLAGYTLSRLWDNTSSGFSSFTAAALNKYNQRPEWAVSGADETNTFKASGLYELPIGPGKTYFNNRKFTGQLLGGWQIQLDPRLRGRPAVVRLQPGPNPGEWRSVSGKIYIGSKRRVAPKPQSRCSAQHRVV